MEDMQMTPTGTPPATKGCFPFDKNALSPRPLPANIFCSWLVKTEFSLVLYYNEIVKAIIELIGRL